MAIPKNGKKKKSLLKAEKEMEVASSDIGLYRDKMKQLDKNGFIKGGGISAFNFFEMLIEQGTSPKDAYKKIEGLVKK